MAAHLPDLDRASLERLRRVVRSLHGRNGGPMPHRHLVRLARDVKTESGVTVDLAASRELGSPMIVVRVPPERPADPRLAALTPREREVVELMSRGLSNTQIAAELTIRISTVKDHVHNILEKSGLPNRAAVVACHAGHLSDA